MRLSMLFWLTALICYSQPFDGYIPPGTVHFSGNLFIDVTEVSNMQWQEFAYYAKKDSSKEYHQFILPSDAVTRLYRPNYYQSTEYRNYPVVGISHEQAREYCKWRTDMVNEKIKVMYQNKALSVNLRLTYRLPTDLEWTIIASQLDTMKYVKPGKYFVEDFVNEKNLSALINLLGDKDVTIRKTKSAIQNHKKNDSIPAYRLEYNKPWFSTIQDQLPKSVFYPDDVKQPNYGRPINMIGNVAEMVREAGKTKGGSWRHKLAVSFPSKTILVNTTSVYDWVGFRCICEVFYRED